MPDPFLNIDFEFFILIAYFTLTLFDACAQTGEWKRSREVDLLTSRQARADEMQLVNKNAYMLSSHYSCCPVGSVTVNEPII